MVRKDSEQTILYHQIAATACAGMRATNPEFKELWVRNMNSLKRKLERIKKKKE